MGDKDPVNYGIVGEHDYPIVYSVFRRWDRKNLISATN
jgi:hypothetical protein